MKDPKQAFLEHFEREWREKAPHSAVWAFETDAALDAVSKALAPQTPEDIAAVWTAWHDLFRTGIVNRGWTLQSDQRRGVELAHMTKHGAIVLEHVRRDPSNPIAYLAHVDAAVPAGSVARSYLAEALGTYGAGFDKATVVLVGCASEALILELRDAVGAKYDAVTKPRPAGTRAADWRMAEITKGLKVVLDGAKPTMTNALKETYDERWSFLVSVIRRARNDVGHPSDVTPVTRDDVHALLLLFSEAAKTTRELIDWVTHHFAP